MVKTRLFVAVVAIGVMLSIGSARAEEASPAPASRAKALALIQQLQGTDADQREGALDRLLQMEPMTAPEIEALAEAMKNPDANVRQCAVQVLADSGPDSIPALTSTLDDSDRQVRGRALAALGEMARRRGYYSDDELSKPSNVAAAVDAVPRIWAILIHAFRNEHEDIRQQAPFCFPAAAVPMLRDALRDSDPNVRSGAANALRRLGPVAKDAAGNLVAALKDPDRNVRDQAAAALVDVDPTRKEVIPVLLERVQDTRAGSNDRYKAIELLARMKSNAQDAVPALAHVLATEKVKTSSLGVPSVTLQWSIVDALGRIGSANAAPVLGQVLTGELVPKIEPAEPSTNTLRPIDHLPPGFVRLLPPGVGLGHPVNIVPLPKRRDPLTELRLFAALSIGQLGANGVAAVPALERAVESDQDAGVRLAAARAIGKIGAGAASAVPALAKALGSDQDPRVRAAAATSIGDVGTAGKPGLPALENALKGDRDPAVRIAAASAIGELAPDDATAISSLIAAMGSGDNSSPLAERNPSAGSLPFLGESVQQTACQALGKIGKPAVPDLIAVLQNPDAGIRGGAARALGSITPLSNTAIAALTLALKDKDSKVRENAAEALSSAGGVAQQAAEAELDREEKADDATAAAEEARRYTEKEIEAPIETENVGHVYDLQFVKSFPIKIAIKAINASSEAEFLVTLHRAINQTDRYSPPPEHLAIWKRTGDDKYQQLDGTDPLGVTLAFDTQYQEPSSFDAEVLVTGQGKDHYERDWFLDIPWLGNGGRERVDDVYVLEPPPFGQVGIQSAEEWYIPQLRDGESVGATGVETSLGENRLKFKFYISGYRDKGAHDASAGIVTGTFKIVKEMHYDEEKKEWTATWKMVPDTAQREPYQETEYHPVSKGLVYPAGVQGPRLETHVATVPMPSETNSSSK